MRYTTQKKIGLVVFITFIILLIILINPKNIAINAMVKHRTMLLAHVENYWSFFILCYTATYFISTTLSLPFATPLSLIGGFLFGPLLGSILIIVSASLGAFGAFSLVRYFFSTLSTSTHASSRKKLENALQSYGSYGLLAVRLTGIIPFFVLNILAGILPISWFTFLWTTFAGITPFSILYAYAGYQLRIINQLGDIITWKTMFFVTVAILLITTPFIYTAIQTSPKKND